MIHKTAIVSNKSRIGKQVAIWAFSQVRERVVVGDNTIIGSYVYVDRDVVIGRNVKIQNSSQLYYGTYVHDEVFIGPEVIIVNDKYPRAVNSGGSLKKFGEWEAGKTVIGRGASIGAGSIVICGVRIGRYALVAAGSVVTADVPDFALVKGNPARLAGIVCQQGHVLKKFKRIPRGKISLNCVKCQKKITFSYDKETI